MNNFIEALGDLVELLPNTDDEMPPPCAYYGEYPLRWDHPDWEMDGWWYVVRPENMEEAVQRLDKCLDAIIPQIVRYFEGRKINREYLELINSWVSE